MLSNQICNKNNDNSCTSVYYLIFKSQRIGRNKKLTEIIQNDMIKMFKNKQCFSKINTHY
ncbi:hypothetical protein T02_3956 [Trichinella nativa]|uniref:Uncharacterized protein n=1 Tax=Trichinella nativa TaxID=6335 RepID=A0A0V1LNQ9_9BILA|nr:hypothetical protein T02_3956 [Trichinella nativa]